MDALRNQKHNGRHEYDNSPSLTGLLVVLDVLVGHALIIHACIVCIITVTSSQAGMFDFTITYFTFKASVEQAAHFRFLFAFNAVYHSILVEV
jgi:hypothetical protein